MTVRASNGAEIRVWRENDLYYARPAGSAVEPQICAAVDLFEVIAELAGLNLEVKVQSAEAVRLSIEAQRELGGRPDAGGRIPLGVANGPDGHRAGPV